MWWLPIYGPLLNILYVIYIGLIYISLASTLPPFTTGLIKYKVLSPQLRTLFFYILVCIAVEILSYIAAKGHVKVFHAIQNLFTVIECEFFLYLFFLEFKSNSTRKIIFIVSILYLLLCALTVFFIATPFKPNNITNTAEACLMMFFAFTYFFRMRGPGSTKFKDQPFFWINTAILLYFMTTFVVFIFSGKLANKEAPIGFLLFASLQRIINISFNTIFAISLWKARRT